MTKEFDERMKEIKAAQEEALAATLERAKDYWGLDYAGGLPYSHNEFGKVPFRPGMTGSNVESLQYIPESVGGKWQTVHQQDNMAIGLSTNKQGWAYSDRSDCWLDFVVDYDVFLILYGFFSDDKPTIHEYQIIIENPRFNTKTRKTLPVRSIDWFYEEAESKAKHYFDLPLVCGPKTRVIIKIRSEIINRYRGGSLETCCPQSPIFENWSCLAEDFGIIGDVVATPSYLQRLTYRDSRVIENESRSN